MFWTFFWSMIADISFPLSGVCCVVHSSGIHVIVVSDGVSLKDVAFILIMIQKALSYIQVLAFVLFWEFLCNVCCTGFMKCSLLWMISWVEWWLTCRCSATLSAVFLAVQNHDTDVFIVVVSIGCGLSLWIFWITYTCATIFELVNLFVHIWFQ